MKTPDEEQKLIAAANAGDRAAMETLYLDYRTWVFRVALKVCENEADAHDVVQEVFRYFFARFPGFTLTCALKTYLYPIIRHKSIDLIRKRKPMLSLDDQAEELAAAPARSEEDTRREVMDLVADLSHEDRELLIARFVDGRKLEEIGGMLGLPTGTVKSRLHHALSRLRKKMKKE